MVTKVFSHDFFFFVKWLSLIRKVSKQAITEKKLKEKEGDGNHS